MPQVVIVVPCFNEADRLPVEGFARFAPTMPGLRFVLVDDGSSDATLEVLRALERRDPRRFTVLDLPYNRGKAEAVRAGMQRAFAEAPDFVGYWDADLATPLEEIPRFVEALEAVSTREMIFGARVQMLGRSIRRRALRHYVGRVFATLASQTLGLPVYDTQCGAKLFRSGPETSALFDEPFLSTWAFDVELVARRIARGGPEGRARARDAIFELPLECWTDMGISKVRPLDLGRATLDLLRIRQRYLRR